MSKKLWAYEARGFDFLVFWLLSENILICICCVVGERSTRDILIDLTFSSMLSEGLETVHCDDEGGIGASKGMGHFNAWCFWANEENLGFMLLLRPFLFFIIHRYLRKRTVQIETVNSMHGCFVILLENLNSTGDNLIC